VADQPVRLASVDRDIHLHGIRQYNDRSGGRCGAVLSASDRPGSASTRWTLDSRR